MLSVPQNGVEYTQHFSDFHAKEECEQCGATVLGSVDLLQLFVTVHASSGPEDLTSSDHPPTPLSCSSVFGPPRLRLTIYLFSLNRTVTALTNLEISEILRLHSCLDPIDQPPPQVHSQIEMGPATPMRQRMW